jgi:isopenicillin N synthase-like dioxygenase
MFKSLKIHRVVTKSERERNSLAVFCIPESEKEIKPIDKLVAESRQRIYKNVKFNSSTIGKGRDM